MKINYYKMKNRKNLKKWKDNKLKKWEINKI
jgi:hypothetical protein